MSKQHNVRRLHKLFILFPLVGFLKALLPLTVFFMFRLNQENGLLSALWPWTAGAGGIILLLLLTGWMDWRRFTYVLEDDKIVIRRGIWLREEQSIYTGRIHSMNMEQPIAQRLFGLTQVKIDTSGKNEDGGKLPAISHGEAEHLQRWLRERTHIRHEDDSIVKQIEEKNELFPGNDTSCRKDAELPAEERTVLLKLSAGRLLLAALTSFNLSLAFAFAAAIASFADDLLPDQLYTVLFKEAGQLLSGGWTAAIILTLILAWLLSAVLYTVKYAGFTVERVGQQIAVTCGLLERKQMFFSPGRVQAVSVKEGLLRQPFGYAEVKLHVLTSDSDKHLVLHPMLPLKEVHGLLHKTVPHFQALPVDTRSPRRALWLYLRLEALFTTAICAGCIWYFKTPGLWSLLLLPLSIFYAYWTHRDTGMALHEKQLILRTRTLARHTRYVRRPQVISLSVKGSRWQRRRKLLSFEVSLISSQYNGQITGMEQADVEHVKLWFMKSGSP
ncbi:PH domain-containing protein [Paenibacillus lemnae]|uniref:PH domain-containing protein n=1 Tax=Paenibacillus lemnae TaxID=1330551 RepID=A0A848M699_PAELE|nr:PH domain-containing protein [Paenibacillus lemnae]NMO95124.1 PH domain-containing protein [Paenibacillus lemnae]